MRSKGLFFEKGRLVLGTFERHAAACIMCTEAKARAFRPDDKELDDDTHAALKYIGVNKEYEGTFPNIEMNTSFIGLQRTWNR